MEGQPTRLPVGNELEKNEDYEEHLEVVVEACVFCVVVEVEQCEQLLAYQVNSLCYQMHFSQQN